MKLLDKLFGQSNKFIRKASRIAVQVNDLEKSFQELSDKELKQKAGNLREKIGSFVLATEHLPEAFALVREAAKRTLGQRHFDEQVLAAAALHYGNVVEMKTGEGKTLAATMPVFLNALIGKGAHLVTVNDYLAQRDTVWMGQIYDFLGLKVGCVVQEGAYIYEPESVKKKERLDEERDEKGAFKVVHEFLRPVSRKEAYRADITYGTNNIFGFDYLRDNLVQSYEDKVQRGFYYAILDEVDSILIDEARTPLIISSPDAEPAKAYQQAARLIAALQEGRDFTVDLKKRSVTFTDSGIGRLEAKLGVNNLYQSEHLETVFHLEQALKARALYKKDKDYVVKDGQVVIVDEFTGRLMPDRRFSEGLHQALEAKEGLEVKQESKTLATISFQNFFRKYERLSGMTGTARPSAEEFQKVYGLDVIEIPTHKPMIRQDLDDQVYATKAGKLKAVIREVKKRHQLGQPVLLGTVSIEANEVFSRALKKAGIPHQVLNAKHHEREGEIIAQAGKKGMVTVATNMAGRGVDIILGGNPQDLAEAQEVKELGGLFVLGTERHEARRIDDQLRGRAGRQGDPGESRFFVSFEDDLIKAFGSDKAKQMLKRLGIPEDQPIENRLISRSIESAQKRIEGYNFDIRKHLLQFDEVVNIQREAVYKLRDEILSKAQTKPEQLREKVLEIAQITDQSMDSWQEKFKQIDKRTLGPVLKGVMLSVLDNLWIHHLSDLDYLRSTIGLRAYGQRDPLAEYKKEAQAAYQDLLSDWRKQVLESLERLEVKEAGAAEISTSRPFFGNLILQGPAKGSGKIASFNYSKQPPGAAREAGGEKGEMAWSLASRRAVGNDSAVKGPAPLDERFKKAGRNDPCPCGSGKKFKKCHGK